MTNPDNAPAALAGELADLISEVYERGYTEGVGDAEADADMLRDEMHEGCAQVQADLAERLTALSTRTPTTDGKCPSCGGLNTSCPEGCGRDLRTGELNGTPLRTPPHDTLLQLAGQIDDDLIAGLGRGGVIAQGRAMDLLEAMRAALNHERTEG